MTSWLQRPIDEELKNIVECYWLAADTPNDVMILPPAISNDILVNFEPPTTISNSRVVFHLDGDYHSGLRTSFYNVNQHGHFRLAGIRFKPWVFALHFGMEPFLHVDQFLSTAAAQGKIAAFNGVREEIEWSMSQQEIVSRLDSFILSRFDFEDEVQFTFEGIAGLIARDDKVSVSGLASGANLSISTLERLFRKYIGISPKALLRIRRYNQIWEILNTGNGNWTDLLYSLGYFDQSHFIREFKHFTGKTPEQYLEGRNSTLDRYRLFDEKVQFKHGNTG